MTSALPTISLWDGSALEQAVDSPMTEDVDTDVAIVGGGFTGLSTALHLAEKNVACHVIEAEKIGYGGSGRNVGLVNAGLWLPPQDIRARLGVERGDRFVEILGDAPRYVFGLIDKHRIQCEAKQNGTIHAAHSPKGFEDLERRAQEWQRLKAPVVLLSREQTAEKIGSNAFYGGLLDYRAGTINPMGYVRGLARAATAAGAKINTGVTAKKLVHEGERWLIRTTAGTVTANKVVLGTNAYTDELWPQLRRCFTKIHYFQVATAPLNEFANHILPERQGVWDTAPIMFNVRRDDYGRLLIGSMGKVFGGDGGLTHKWAKRNIQRLFPDIERVDIETAWYGQIAMTPDHLPRIYRLAENLYTPIGYNGRGITPGTIFGKAMADHLTGGVEADLPLPITSIKPVKSAPFMSRVYELSFAANQIIKSI